MIRASRATITMPSSIRLSFSRASRTARASQSTVEFIMKPKPRTANTAITITRRGSRFTSSPKIKGGGDRRGPVGHEELSQLVEQGSSSLTRKGRTCFAASGSWTRFGRYATQWSTASAPSTSTRRSFTMSLRACTACGISATGMLSAQAAVFYFAAHSPLSSIQEHSGLDVQSAWLRPMQTDASCRSFVASSQLAKRNAEKAAAVNREDIGYSPLSFNLISVA